MTINKTPYISFKQTLRLILGVYETLALARLRSYAVRAWLRKGKTAGDQKETNGD